MGLSYPISYVTFGPMPAHTSMYGQLGLMDSITHSEMYLFHDTLLVTISVIFLSVVLYYLIVTNTGFHAFSLPNFFVKCDAVPRRLNTSYINSDVPRLAYGQCSEICGVNHSFIPICLEFVNWEGFIESVAGW